MIIKVDVDGVIRDIISFMCQFYNDEFGTAITVEDIVEYDIDNFFELVNEKYGMLPTKFFFKKHGVKTFMDSKPFEDAAEAIKKLREKGHKAVIVTWQITNWNKIATLGFLEKNDIEYDDICFTKDKWLINGDYLIDDNPDFILDERDKSNKIIIDRPYNRKVDNENVKRCSSLEDAVCYILENEKQ